MLFLDSNLLSPIWDIVQMATSIICCCAPIFRSLFLDLHIIKPLKSLFSSITNRSRYKTGTTSLEASDSSAGHSQSRTFDQNWLRIGGNTDRQTGWTEVATGPYNPQRQNYDVEEQPSHPMRTLEVRQSVGTLQ